MFEGIAQLAAKATAAFGIYGLLVVSYTLLGAWKNINIWRMHWEWKLWANGLVKYALLGLAILSMLVCSYAVLALAPSWGVEVVGAEQVGTKVIFGVVAAGIVAMLLKNVQKLAQIIGVNEETLVRLQESAARAGSDEPLILDVGDLPGGRPVRDTEIDDKTAKRAVQELVGGKGAYVATSSPDAFRNDVIGKGYDVDGQYGWQCWDGFALFTVGAYGKMPPTGNGAARGCWELKRAEIAAYGMELITDRSAIQKGDWLVFGGTRWGHVGMAMGGDLGGYVRLLGQNQGSGAAANPAGGSAFNEVNMSLNHFLGAFRPKMWHATPVAKPAPALATRPQATAKAAASTFYVGQTVVPTNPVDYDTGKPLKVWDPSYTIVQLKGKRAVLQARGQIWSAISTDNIRPA